MPQTPCRRRPARRPQQGRLRPPYPPPREFASVVAIATNFVYRCSNHDFEPMGHMTKRAMNHASFASRLAGACDRLGPTELRVARFLSDNREVALVSSAGALASRLGTSDATIIRTVQAVGYSGLAEFRRELAGELRDEL